MSTVPDKTPQKEIHTEQEKRMEMAQKMHAAKEGMLPDNQDLTSGLSKAQAGITANNDQLSATGKLVTQDITNLIETAKTGLNEKNQGNLLQKAYYHGNQTGTKTSLTERLNQLRGQNLGSGDKAALRGEAKENVSSMATIVRLAFLSPEFRQTINEIAQITNQLLKRKDEQHQQNQVGAAPVTAAAPTVTGGAPISQTPIGAPTGVTGASGLRSGQPKLTQEQKEDKLIERLVDLAQTLHHNPEYRNSVQYIASSMDHLKGHVQEKKAEASVAHAADVSRQPQAEIEHHKKEAQLNTKEFVENWIGDGYSLDRLLQQVHFLHQQSKNDPELRSLLNDWKTWTTTTIQDAAYVEDKERVRRDVKDLIHRSRVVVNGPYRDEISILRREVNYINKAIQRDNTIQDMRSGLNQLARDLVMDQNGRAVIKPELLGDAQKIIAGILETINYIPLPPIHRNDEDLELQLDNIVLTATEVMPSNVRFIVQADTEQTGADQSRQNDNFFVIEVAKIHAHLTSVNFFIDKKTGFPKVTERGLADIDLSGTDGLSLRIVVAPHVQKTGNQMHSVFEAKEVTCDIDRLRIHLRETKHDFLYKLVGPFLNMAAKKRIETGVADSIRDGINKLNSAISSGATSTTQKAEQVAHDSSRVQTETNSSTSANVSANVPAHSQPTPSGNVPAQTTL